MQFIKSVFIALALFSTIGGTTASTKRNTDIQSGTVYICTGPKATSEVLAEQIADFGEAAMSPLGKKGGVR